MRLRLQIWWGVYRKTVITAATIVMLVLVFALLLIFRSTPNPVPQDIKSRVNFPILYPSNFASKASDWQYQDNNKSVTYTIKAVDYSAVVTEQQVPLAYQDDQAAYDRFIGGLRPSANFNTPLGTVSIANFVTAGDYNVVGKTAILKADGTLVLIHPSRDLKDDEWRDLFKAIKTD